MRVEIVDPVRDPEQESTGEQQIWHSRRAVPGGGSLPGQCVNSYFDVLVEYGDEYEVLSFADLIEVKAGTETERRVIQTRVRCYALNKKVLYGFQNGASIFANINDDVRLVAYLSADAVLPEALGNSRRRYERWQASLAP